MLKYAQTLDLSGTTSNIKNLGIWVLKNPMSSEISMIALVASDATVLANVTINGDVTDTDNVPDTAIYSAVAAKWATVATKFANYSITGGNSGPAV